MPSEAHLSTEIPLQYLSVDYMATANVPAVPDKWTNTWE